MNIREHSSKFNLYVFSTDVDLGASCKVHLSQAGYDAYFFQSEQDLFSRVKESAPHLVIFTTSSLVGSLSH
ncbi:MAG: GGDEF domain-containing protein, partial [Bdellovibrionia bacterium]